MNDGGHLVTITSTEEMDAIFNEVSSSSIFYFIGLSDEAQEGTWVWVTGEPYDYSNWSKNEPNGGTNENCGELYTWYSPKKWCDLGCTDLTHGNGTGYICESN